MPQTLSGTHLPVERAVAHIGCSAGWVRMLIRTGRLAANNRCQRLWIDPLEAATAA